MSAARQVLAFPRGAAADKTHNFNTVAFPKPSGLNVLFIEYFTVDFHGHLRHIQLQILEQVLHGYCFTHIARVTIDLNVHALDSSTNAAPDQPHPVHDTAVSDDASASYESLSSLVNFGTRLAASDAVKEPDISRRNLLQ